MSLPPSSPKKHTAENPSRAATPGRASPRAFTAAHLREAIAKGWVVVEYQPKVPFAAADQRYSVEALTRIRHPELGLVPPDSFIATAEQCGLIGELTDAVVCRALADWRNWFDHGLTLRTRPQRLARTARR